MPFARRESDEHKVLHPSGVNIPASPETRSSAQRSLAQLAQEVQSALGNSYSQEQVAKTIWKLMIKAGTYTRMTTLHRPTGRWTFIAGVRTFRIGGVFGASALAGSLGSPSDKAEKHANHPSS